MGFKMNNITLLVLFFSLSIIQSMDNVILLYKSYHRGLYDYKTYELKYDDGEPEKCYSGYSYYINEPFENGWGFYFDINDFEILKNKNEFIILEIMASVYRPSQSIDPESVQVLCAGKGDRNGPKGPDYVFFAVPHGGIKFTGFFYGWYICSEKDGPWGKDDGAKYDYNGLPYLCKKDDCKNEYGYWLWVALTQVNSDNDKNDNDYYPYINADSNTGHHCFKGENYNWREVDPSDTLMIRLKIEIDSGPGIEISSIGIIKSIFNK